MPLPLIVSCFSKIQIGFTCLVPAHLGSPGKRAVKRVCVCVKSDSWCELTALDLNWKSVNFDSSCNFIGTEWPKRTLAAQGHSQLITATVALENRWDRQTDKPMNGQTSEHCFSLSSVDAASVMSCTCSENYTKSRITPRVLWQFVHDLMIVLFGWAYSSERPKGALWMDLLMCL